MRIRASHTYEDIISVDNLIGAWGEFVKGKRNNPDVREFAQHLMLHILALHQELADGSYTHGEYHAFKINDPKPRDIHKAMVRDRLLHHAIYRQLYPFFRRTFVSDSYSCQKEKGVHRAMHRFCAFAYKESRNNTRTCWVLKCDIRKFFASIDHDTLFGILHAYIADDRILQLLLNVIRSFNVGTGKGLPLGNLTSQLLVNVYMNEFDQFAKHQLKAKYYIRYADDFVFLSHDRAWLKSLTPRIKAFLFDRLQLDSHPKKVSIGTLAAGVDFLGWIHFFDHRTLRTVTKRRMLRALQGEPKPATVASYKGMLTHGNTHKLSRHISALYSFSWTSSRSPSSSLDSSFSKE